MYRPKKIELINFGSHENTLYEFRDNKAVLIQGVNETNQGQKSNGSGKSFIIEALSFALLGSSLRKVKDKELVRDGEKEAVVHFVLENLIKKKTLTITRKIYSNTKSGELIIDENEDITSVNEGNQFILEELGITRDDILNYFLLSKERFVSFFTASDTSKKELINRFSKADRINLIIESFKHDQQDFEIKASRLTGSLENKNTLLEALKSGSGIDNVQEIDNLTEECSVIQDEIFSLKESQKEFKTKITSLFEEVKKAEEVVKTHEPSIKNLKSSLKEYQDLMDEMERHFKNEVECPKCSYHFSLKDDKFSLDEAKKLYPQIKESIADIVTEKQFQEEELKKAESSLKFSKEEYQNASFEWKRIENAINTGERNIESNLNQIEKLSQVTDNRDKISNLEKEVIVIQKELSEIKKDLSNSKEWELRFKRFKGWIANKSLNNIQQHANFYLDKLDSDMSLELEGYTPINGGKELREKINAKISRHNEEFSYARFSGGERARIEIATILSMQRIINQSTDDSGLDLLVLDEVVESVDSTGLESLLKSLNILSLNVLLITHSTLDSNYENIVTVSKLDNISKIS